jgi:hypothetical protein
MPDQAKPSSFVIRIDSYTPFFHRLEIVNLSERLESSGYILKDFERFINTFHNNIDGKSKPNLA